MPLPDRVLIDTSAFYALISIDDRFHVRSKQLYEGLLDWGQELWTTSYILVEMANLVHRRLGIEALMAFVDSVNGVVQIFWVEQTVHSKAWDQLVTQRNAGLSFVDWSTVVSASRLKAHVFTFDSGFAAQGIPVLPRYQL